MNVYKAHYRPGRKSMHTIHNTYRFATALGMVAAFLFPVTVWGGGAQGPEGGGLWVMGDNRNGQLGDEWLDGGAQNRRFEPIQLNNLDSYTTVAAGPNRSFFLKTNGTLQGSGKDIYVSGISPPFLASSGHPMDLAHNVRLFCAAHSNKYYYTVSSIPNQGGNSVQFLPSFYQNWDGNTRLSPYSGSFECPGESLIEVISGSFHRLALAADGTLYGWAGNYDWEQKPIFDPPLEGIVSAASGDSTVYYVKNNGELWSSGLNSYGQLGRGTALSYSDTFGKVADKVRKVRAGYSNAFFIKDDDTLWAFGLNIYGQLGDGTSKDRNVPVIVASGVNDVSAGPGHTLFSKKDGTLWGMGSNDSGQLGIPSVYQSPVPVQIAKDVTSFAAGGIHSLFVGRNATRNLSIDFKGGFTRKPCYVDALVQLTDSEGYGVVLPPKWLNPGEDLFELKEDGASLSKTEHFLQIAAVAPVASKIRTVLLVDCSSSMGMNFLKVKASASAIIDSMLSNQEMAIASFSGSSRLIQSFTSNKETLKAAVSGMRLGDASTDLYGCMHQFMDLWPENFSLNGIETGFMVVLTDGKDTTGRSSLSAVAAKRDGLKRKVFTVSVGSLTDPTALEYLGNGGSYNPYSFDDLAAVFTTVQKKIQSLGKSLYWVNYGSPKRGNASRSLSLAYRYNQNKGSGAGTIMTFNSNGFSDIKRSVVINRSVYSTSGLSGSLKLAKGEGIQLEATTLLPLTESSYSYTFSDPNLAATQSKNDNGSKAFLEGGVEDGIVKMTVIDVPNYNAAQGLGVNPNDFSRVIEVIVGSVPKIAIEQPTGTKLVDSSSKTLFGSVKIKSAGRSKSFKITNLGTGPLENLRVTVSGRDAKDFVVEQPTTKILKNSGDSVSFKVTFRPNAKGNRKALLSVMSNDVRQGPFDISLHGLGVK